MTYKMTKYVKLTVLNNFLNIVSMKLLLNLSLIDLQLIFNPKNDKYLTLHLINK